MHRATEKLLLTNSSQVEDQVITDQHFFNLAFIEDKQLGLKFFSTCTCGQKPYPVNSLTEEYIVTFATHDSYNYTDKLKP